jgi:hypothetical protein
MNLNIDPVNKIIESSEINKGNLYLSDIFVAGNKDKLSDLCIKAVISVCLEGCLLTFDPEIRHLLIKIEDFPGVDIKSYF